MLLLGLVGCGDPSPLTLVDELRVLAIRLEPASPAPGEIPDVDVLIADPTDGGHTTHTWWCVQDDCGTGPVPDGESLVVWALACAPGACEGPGDDLADPDTWMADLPIAGVSLARRTAPISPSAAERINANPRIGPLAPGVLESVGVDATVPLDVPVTDADVGPEGAAVFGFATAGGFRQPVAPVVDGVARLDLLAPSAAGPFDVILIADDGFGGTDWLVLPGVPVR